ncbi:insulinase family protein [Enterovibrio sp. ZSDZ35]|uniref:Insulinase family protein n=1 Tax=Enterovibrio qingdaonensis TaxID=2899818 RepID=A0ABT5QLM8_9GAMM|nr:insulinase family protein [Enterovibrio sp. ZSDZ35]MDD1781774.1 insulinase family protein [Enterovibrio sp. ZSDZ35]
MRKFILTFLLIGLVGCQTTSQAPVTNDPDWVVGTLENGLTYHIYPNDKDEAVSVRLVFNVGSLQETDSQLGYAHFLEHMAFNGSTHFKRNEIDAFLRSVGVTMGHGANAFTSAYETVYFVDLPDNSSLEKTVTWFSDIAYGLDLDAQAIEGEIGVVHGEWLQASAQGKPYGYAIYEHIADQSKLGTRDPIGTDVSIKAVDKEGLTAFYNKWYQPQLAHVVISGDVNQQDALNLLEEKFGLWKKGTTPVPEKYIAPPAKGEPAVLSDTGSEGASIAYVFDMGEARFETEGELFESWTEDAAISLISSKISDVMLGVTGDALGAQVFKFQAGGREYLLIRAQIPRDMRDEVQNAISREIAGLRDKGATENAVNNMRWFPGNRKSAKEDDKNLTTKDRTNFYTFALLNEYPVLSVDETMRLRLSWSQYLTRGAFNKRLKSILSSPPAIYAFYDGGEVEEEVAQSVASATDVLLAKGKSKQLTGKQILAGAKGSGSVLEERQEATDLHVWSLSNGVEVWYQRNAKAGNDVRMAIGSKGGRSMLTSDLNAASYLLADTLFLSGLGGMDTQTLLTYINERGIAFWPDITPTRHAIQVYSHKRSVSDALVILHHILSEPLLDESALKMAKRTLTNESYNFSTSVGGIYDQGVFDWLRGDNSAYQFASTDDVMLTTLEQVESAHRALFNQSNPITLYIYANVDPKRLKRAVEKNIASVVFEEDAGIPLNTQQSTWAKEVSPVLSVSQEEPNKALSALYVLSDAKNDMSAKTVFIDELVNRIAYTRTFDEVREAQSLTYTPNVWELSVDNEATTGWGFAAVVEPVNAKRTNQVFEEIVAGLSKGITESEFEFVSKQLKEAMQDNDINADVQTNMYGRYLFNGWGVDTLLNVNETVDSITFDEVNNRTKLIFGANSKLVKGYNMPAGQFAPR